MNPTIPQTLYIVYFDAASGHRSAAQHLAHAINQKGIQRSEIINLTDIFDRAPRFGRIVRRGINFFNAAIRKDRLFDLGGLINLSLLFHDTLSKKSLQQMATFWENKKPSAVISVTPMYNPALKRSLELHFPDVPYLCLPVDMEERKARYWFTPKVKITYLCATPALMERGKKTGVPPEHLIPLSGMPAHIDTETQLDKKALFEAWGFREDWPTCFVSFGGQGTIEVLRIADEAEKQGIEANFLFFCGKNDDLFNTLEKRIFQRPKKLFRYLPHAPTAYLRIADLLIGKPGAMTLAEAQLAGIPLFALKSTGLKLVQRGNEEYIQNNHLGDVFPSIRDLVKAIPAFDRYRALMDQAPRNQALEEACSYCLQHINKSSAFNDIHDKTLLTAIPERSNGFAQ